MPDGSYRDNVSREVIKPPVHIGHAYGWENRRLLKAADELGMTQKQLNDYVNARPNRFRLENATQNLSHRHEKPGSNDMEDIKRDMIYFMKLGR